MHIGQHIKTVMRTKNVTVTDLAGKIGTTRTNMHKIFRKENIDIALLMKISKELQHDFFKDISLENTF
ncbi:MAG: helix-turn-helix domain-containing protein [Bacteroidales bacterium]|nr:helix-turn-helix domain-containing protein [Bacteroidales bacterium]